MIAARLLFHRRSWSAPPSLVLPCAQNLAFQFAIFPALKPSQQLLNAYTTKSALLCSRSGAVAAASTTLNQRLQAISAGIQVREAALKGRLPQFVLLDPARMPYYTYT